MSGESSGDKLFNGVASETLEVPIIIFSSSITDILASSIIGWFLSSGVGVVDVFGL